MKAGEYGIQNLKYIMSHLNEWLEDDPDGQHRQVIYQAIGNQYYRYLKNVMYNVGGIYLTEGRTGLRVNALFRFPGRCKRTRLNG